MAKIRSDKSALEYLVQDFLIAAGSETLRPACDIFLMHANDLTVGDPRQNLMLVDLDADDDWDEALDVVSARTSVDGARVAKEILPAFLGPVKSAVARIKQSVQGDQKLTPDAQAILIGQFLQPQHRDELGPLFSRALANNVGIVADLLGHALFKLGLDTRNRQIAATVGVIEYDDMVEALERMKVFVPRVRVVLCGECWNLEVAIGRYSGFTNECTRCQREAHVVSLLFPRPELEQLKLNNNSDLPLFISAYLRCKAPLPVRMAPCREYEEPIAGEVDVAIDELDTAVEVKVLNSPATMNPQKVANEAHDLATQLRKYATLGFKKTIVITNAPQAETAKLLETAQAKWPTPTMRVEAYGAPFGTIRARLDLLGADLQSAVNAKLQKEMEGRSDEGPAALPR